MKITRVEPFIVHAPERGRNFTFVKIWTDAGITGLGEAGITWREATVAALIESWAPLLVGMDASRIEHIWQTFWRGQFFRGGHIQGAALAAIDIALWDIRGKALGVPVYDLLGGKVRDYARCYCHVQQRGAGDRGIDAMVELASQRVAEGWEFVRFGVGEGSSGEGAGIYEQSRAMRWTIDAFSALRDTLGPEIEIAVDFHQRTTPTYAVQLARALEPMRPFFIEDPIRAENTTEFRALRQQIAVPIATGEQLASKWEWQTLIEEDLMDYCRVDLCICGGITESRKVAAWCETHYIEQAPHNPLGPISTAACLHFDLSTPLFAVQELVWRPDVIADVVQTDMRLEGGKLFSGGSPGLGVELDEEAARAHAPAPAQLIQLHRDDGSVTDW